MARLVVCLEVGWSIPQCDVSPLPGLVASTRPGVSRQLVCWPPTTASYRVAKWPHMLRTTRARSTVTRRCQTSWPCAHWTRSLLSDLVLRTYCKILRRGLVECAVNQSSLRCRQAILCKIESCTIDGYIPFLGIYIL